jgi:F-type H+-transporting ATPase subunit epsilon
MGPGLFSLTVLCPEKDFFEGEAREVVFSTPMGRLGVMAGHAPMVAAVAEGLLEIISADGLRIAAVGQGFAEIAYDKAEFFLDTAEWAEEIDAVRAKDALARAQQKLHSSMTRIEHLRTQAAMSRALARLKAAESSAMPKEKGK